MNDSYSPQHRRCFRSLLFLLFWVTVLPPAICAADAEDVPTSSVGVATKLEQVVLPGSVLEARPLEDRQVPIVLRIVEVYPHGSEFRYDLEYYGLEPGEFDLREFLQRQDGSSTDDLPALPVTITSTLPPGQIVPNELASLPRPRLGGYRLTLIAGGIVWVAGLIVLILARRRRPVEEDALVRRPRTLDERLRPMVESAMRGGLTNKQQAELERLLVAFWRRRLQLDSTKAADALATLRRHPEAGELLRQLEAWLHRPATTNQPVDIERLLQPYRRVADEAA